MKNKTKITKEILLILILLAIFLIPQVISLGITPGLTSIQFQSGASKNIALTILNNEHKNMNVRIMATMDGDLNNSVVLSSDQVLFMPSEESKDYHITLNLPANLSPGTHKGEIIALEMPREEQSGNSVGATVAVVSQLAIYVDCPGKCIEPDLDVLDAEQNGTATFIVPIISRGKLGIGSANAVIDIYNLANEKIGSVVTDTQSIEPGARAELSGKWPVNANSGDYIAKVTVIYDGETTSFEKQFSVGQKSILIDSMNVNSFKLGDIAKLQILVENKWNQDLSDVYANLLVYDSNNQVMSDVKSSSETVPALSKKELVAYWDTVGIKEGEYSGKLMVKYGQKSTDQDLVLKVSENSLDISGVGYATRPMNSSKGISITTILVILVVILIMINIAWFVLFKKVLSNKNKVIQN